MFRRAAPFLAVIAALAAVGAGVAQTGRNLDQVASQRTRDLQAAADTRRQIQDLRNELIRLNMTKLATAGRDVDIKRARLEALNLRESALVADLGRNRHHLARLLSALQLFRRDPPPALLVSPANARDAVRAAILIRAMTPELQRRADAYGGRLRAVGALRRQAAAASEDLFTAESVVADRKGELERMIIEKTRLERAYAQDALTGGPASTQDGERRMLGALTDALAPLQSNGPLVLVPPAPGAVSHRFGEALPAGGRAQGVSIRTESGQTVASPAQGAVDYVGPLSGWGVVVIVRTQGAYRLVLAGLDQASVSTGQTVAAGAPIGRMSDKGQADQDLYLEVREDGVPVDPGKWLKPGSR